MQSYTRDALPDSFKNMFTPLSEPNRTNSFKLDRIKNDSLAHFPTYFLPKVWNSNSLTVKNILPKNLFKNTLKKSMLSSYHSSVKCNSSSCTDCTKWFSFYQNK